MKLEVPPSPIRWKLFKALNFHQNIERAHIITGGETKHRIENECASKRKFRKTFKAKEHACNELISVFRIYCYRTSSCINKMQGATRNQAFVCRVSYACPLFYCLKRVKLVKTVSTSFENTWKCFFITAVILVCIYYSSNGICTVLWGFEN